mgnify:FL=1
MNSKSLVLGDGVVYRYAVVPSDVTDTLSLTLSVLCSLKLGKAMEPESGRRPG